MAAPAVPVVGLTGGIGSGKSTALAALERLGAEVISTDAVVHELYESERVRAAVVERFGEEVAPGGSVDRSRLAERAFASAEDRAFLEGLLWPLVGERVAAWLERVRAIEPPPRAAVMEVPLLFESGMDAACDATITLTAGEQLRRERVAGREQVGIEQRAARQLSEQEKARRATFVVRNDGTLEQLEAELSAVLAKLEP